MVQRTRNLILIVLAAAAGALVGRWIAEARSRLDSGDDPLAVDLHDLHVRPQDFVPGVIAAFRVGEPPWSWLHIPAWLAAFGTNFATAAVGGDLDRLRRMAEERALSAFGLDSEDTIEVQDVPPAAPAEPASPFTAQQPPQPPPRARPAPESGQPVWTSENAAPRATNGNGRGPEAEAPGFTPFHD